MQTKALYDRYWRTAWILDNVVEEMRKVDTGLSDLKLLDIGCCNGVMSLDHMINAGFKPENTSALDGNPDQVRVISEKHPGIDAFTYDFNWIEKDQFLSQLRWDGYDMILCTELLEHLEGTKPQETTLFRGLLVLKQGGHMIISFPRITQLHNEMHGHRWMPNIPRILDIMSDHFESVQYIRPPRPTTADERPANGVMIVGRHKKEKLGNVALYEDITHVKVKDHDSDRTVMVPIRPTDSVPDPKHVWYDVLNQRLYITDDLLRVSFRTDYGTPGLVGTAINRLDFPDFPRFNTVDLNEAFMKAAGRRTTKKED